MEVNDFFFAVGADPQGYEDRAFLGSEARFAFDHQAVQDEDLVVIGQFSAVIGLDGGIELLGDAADGGGTDGLA